MASLVLLTVVRPNLGGRVAQPVGFPAWAALTAGEVLDAMAVDERAEHIAALSRIAVTKHRALQHAVDLTRAAIACGVLAALLTAAGVTA
ncbi:Pycsar system effector family protein [Streptomyces celluloflavus]|uniref:Pycsar system effector family protein n=1 Tax=Streptomyces celluloflavus TaxID=58344 RepID=UPI0036D7C5F4